MMRRTLHLGKAVQLRKRDMQLVASYPPAPGEAKGEERTIPIAEIGMLVLEDPQIMLSHALMAALMDAGAVIVCCDEKHLPSGMMLPMDGHSLHHEVFKAQYEATEPLKKNLWAQTVKAKIANQAALLRKLGYDAVKLEAMVGKVKSGDVGNLEARAAAIYWSLLFGEESRFVRGRFGEPPNHLLNYGYAILRATVARALVGSGLFPVLGIHHSNQYNAYCLADDIMEPYRPFVDARVCEIVSVGAPEEALTPEMKQQLLKIQQMDVVIKGETSPIITAVTRTTASLAACFLGEQRRIAYPDWK